MLESLETKGFAMDTTETQPTAQPRPLQRSRDERVLAGVAGGLADYFDLSPLFFRLAFAVLTLVGGAGILLYAVAALVIPDQGRTDSVATEALRRHRERPWLLVGVALVGIATVSIAAQADFWPNSGFAWTLLILGALAIALAQRRDRRRVEPGVEGATLEAQPVRREPSLFLPVLGLLLAFGGLLALVSALGVDVRWDIALAAAAAVVGAIVAVGAYLRRRIGGLVAIGVVLAALALLVSAIDIRLEGPVGERTFQPVSASELNRSYDLAVGELTVDLADTRLASGETPIDVNVGVGDLTVVVPADVAVEVDATASAGSVTVFGAENSGVDAQVTRRDAGGTAGGARLLRVDAHVGLGAVTVVRDSG
jgi:phage shock protein PspC (stress-responsive transcriptional regulator)